MRKTFDQQLQTLHEEMSYMGSLCEDAIQITVDGLLKGDSQRLKTINNMMTQITQQERSIENICLKLLMQQQPVASDLRVISSSLKMVTDMERIGIQACEIAEIITVGNALQVSNKVDFETLSNEVTNIVRMSLQAFSEKNLELANEVVSYDDVIDKLFGEIRDELVAKLKQANGDAESFVDMLMIDKYMERIADHAVNIAKWVKFSITGEIEIV